MASIHDAFAAYRNIGDCDAEFFECLRGVQDRVMFDGCRNDVLARFLRGRDDSEEREIVGFGTAAGEDDFGWLGTH